MFNFNNTGFTHLELDAVGQWYLYKSKDNASTKCLQRQSIFLHYKEKLKGR